MGKLSKALGLDMDMEAPPASESMPMDEGDDELAEEKPKADTASAEVLAMKQFDRASTPEAKVQALKDFLEACGLY